MKALKVVAILIGFAVASIVVAFLLAMGLARGGMLGSCVDGECELIGAIGVAPTLSVLIFTIFLLVWLCSRRNRRQSDDARSEEHTSELQSLMRISYAVFRLKKKIT